MGLQARVTASLMASTSSFRSREGSSFTYSRGAVSATLTLYPSDQLPVLVDDGTGQITEMLMTDFRGLLSDFDADFGRPKTGDTITDGTTNYEVRPKLGSKPYHAVGGLVHIYAKVIN